MVGRVPLKSWWWMLLKLWWWSRPWFIGFCLHLDYLRSPVSKRRPAGRSHGSYPQTRSIMPWRQCPVLVISYAATDINAAFTQIHADLQGLLICFAFSYNVWSPFCYSHTNRNMQPICDEIKSEFALLTAHLTQGLPAASTLLFQEWCIIEAQLNVSIFSLNFGSSNSESVFDWLSSFARYLDTHTILNR